MTERRQSLRRPDGEMDIFIFHPAGAGIFPPVILYMDMWGIREAFFGIARNIAAAGYYCILPDSYYRRGRIRYAPVDVPGRRLSFADLEPQRQVMLRAAMESLSDAMVIEDTAALLDFLGSGEPVRPGPVGAVGYCMGARHAFCVAGGIPGRFKAIAGLHGTDLIKPGDGSPHLLVQRMDGELYCGHAGRDKYAPIDIVDRLDAALSGSRVRHQRRVHANAQHGYAVPDRDIYDRQATEQDWRAIFAMLHRQLMTQGA